MLNIRLEEIVDFPEIREVNNRAFGQPAEGKIVEELRKNCKEVLSVVAKIEEKVVGQIFFSPAVLKCADRKIEGMGLALMAVLPEYQNLGIGSNLINVGIKIIKGSGCPFIIVLDHEKYYPRFGFKPASDYDIKYQWENIPDEAFMILILKDEDMKNVCGTAYYRKEFENAV